MSTSAYPVQRRRRGPLRAVIITLIVLLAVLVVADRAVAYVAASKIAGQLQSRLGTSAEPQVSIAGFPLLTQAVAGTYERVQITATGVDAKELDKVDVRLDLREVRLPLSDALAGDVSHGRVGRADVAIDISEASLSTLTGLPITIDGLTDQVARLSTTFDVFGQKVPVSIHAMVIIEGTNAADLPRRVGRADRPTRRAAAGGGARRREGVGRPVVAGVSRRRGPGDAPAVVGRGSSRARGRGADGPVARTL